MVLNSLKVCSLILLLASCVKKVGVNTTTGSTYGTPIVYTPPTVVSPWVCSLTTKTLLCQSVSEFRYRRGQIETIIAPGTQLCWKDPKGPNGKGQVWFGCSGTSSCSGGHIFSSSSVSVTPCDTSVQFIKGKEDVIPFGSLGIVDVEIEAEEFRVLRNRFTGLMAPPIINPGTNTTVTCTLDTCTITATAKQ